MQYTLDDFLKEWNDSSETVTLKTSGSTGKPKNIELKKSAMVASALRTCDFLGLRKGDTALLCLPLEYIAGKMMAVRAIVRDLSLISVTASGHPLKGQNHSFDFVAMTPMQVYNSLQDEEEERVLRKIRHLIIGGGHIDEELEERLRAFPNAVWSTYGMTETLSHVAMRRLNGDNYSQWYQPLKDVVVDVNIDGCLVVHDKLTSIGPLHTNDLAEMNIMDRSFRITGRLDNVICCGGLKFQIEEIEAEIKSHINIPFIISKRRDNKFGYVPVLVMQSVNEDDLRKVKLVCENVLPKYKRPKEYILSETLPMTETGKPKRLLS